MVHTPCRMSLSTNTLAPTPRRKGRAKQDLRFRRMQSPAASLFSPVPQVLQTVPRAGQARCNSPSGQALWYCLWDDHGWAESMARTWSIPTPEESILDCFIVQDDQTTQRVQARVAVLDMKFYALVEVGFFSCRVAHKSSYRYDYSKHVLHIIGQTRSAHA